MGKSPRWKASYNGPALRFRVTLWWAGNGFGRVFNN
jgi:hypothetical protein